MADYCRGEDCLNTMRAFQSLGVRIDETAEQFNVHGKGMWGLTEPIGPIDCGNSGTGIRLMTGLLAGQDFFTVLTGDESIRRRPMGRIVKPLREMGATIAGRKGGELAPLAITGTRSDVHGLFIAGGECANQIVHCCLPPCMPKARRPLQSRVFRGITPNACLPISGFRFDVKGVRFRSKDDRQLRWKRRDDWSCRAISPLPHFLWWARRSCLGQM